jgi:hypothetical protein
MTRVPSLAGVHNFSDLEESVIMKAGGVKDGKDSPYEPNIV